MGRSREGGSGEKKGTVCERLMGGEENKRRGKGFVVRYNRGYLPQVARQQAHVTQEPVRGREGETDSGVRIEGRDRKI